jgi:hypothetical protein
MTEVTAATLGNIPSRFQKFIRLLAESFGNETEMRKHIKENTLWELLMFPGFAAVAKPWAAKIELENYGFKSGSYRVYNEAWEFQHEVWPDDQCFGTNPLDITLLWTIKNGSLLRIIYEGEDDIQGGLIVCQNELPSQQERYWIKVWDEANKVALWRPDDHEFLIRLPRLPNIGYIRIHYLPGRFTEPRQASDFYYYEDGEERGLKEAVEFLDIPIEQLSNWYPKRSGWYLIRHQFALLYNYHYCLQTESGVNFNYCQKDEFPGSVRVVRREIVCSDLSCSQELEYDKSGYRFAQNRPVKFAELTGVGLRRIRYHQEGIFYLDLSGNNLAPALPGSNVFGVGTPQHASDTSRWTRLEGTLIYHIQGKITDTDEDMTLVLNREWVIATDEDGATLVGRT